MRAGICLHQQGAFGVVPTLEIVTDLNRAKNMPDKTTDFYIGHRTIVGLDVYHLLINANQSVKESYAAFNCQ